MSWNNRGGQIVWLKFQTLLNLSSNDGILSTCDKCSFRTVSSSFVVEYHFWNSPRYHPQFPSNIKKNPKSNSRSRVTNPNKLLNVKQDWTSPNFQRPSPTNYSLLVKINVNLQFSTLCVPRKSVPSLNYVMLVNVMTLISSPQRMDGWNLEARQSPVLKI